MPEKFRQMMSYKIKGCRDLKGMEEIVRGSGQYFNYINLAGFLTRLAKLPVKSKNDAFKVKILIQKIESLFTPKMIDSLNEQALANSLWAFAKLQNYQTENTLKLFYTLLNCADQKNGFRGQEIANILWAMAVTNQSQIRDFNFQQNKEKDDIQFHALQKFTHLATLRAKDMNPQELTLVLWSAGKMNFYNFGMFQKLLDEQIFREKGLIERDIANTLWACSKMRHFSKSYMQEVLTQMHVLNLRFQTRFLNPQICSQILHAMATFNFTHRAATRDLIQYVLDEGDGRNIMDALYALTILQYPFKHIQMLISALNQAWKPDAKIPASALAQFYLTYRIIRQKMWHEKFPEDLIVKAKRARRQIVQEDLSVRSSWLVGAVVGVLQKMGGVQIQSKGGKYLERLNQQFLLESNENQSQNLNLNSNSKLKVETNVKQNLGLESQQSLNLDSDPKLEVETNSNQNLGLKSQQNLNSAKESEFQNLNPDFNQKLKENSNQNLSMQQVGINEQQSKISENYQILGSNNISQENLKQNEIKGTGEICSESDTKSKSRKKSKSQAKQKFLNNEQVQNQQTEFSNPSKQTSDSENIKASFKVLNSKFPAPLLDELDKDDLQDLAQLEQNESYNNLILKDEFDHYHPENQTEKLDLKFEPLVISEDEDYVIDLVINYNQHKIALMCNSRTCYSQVPPYIETGTSRAFRAFLQDEGWKVAVVPFHEWLALKKDSNTKQKYILDKLNEAIQTGDQKDLTAFEDWRLFQEDVNFRMKRMQSSKELMEMVHIEQLDFSPMNLSACITKLAQLKNEKKIDPKTVILDMRYLAKMLNMQTMYRLNARQIASCAWAFGKTGHAKEQGQQLLIQLLKRGMEFPPEQIVPQTNSMLIWSMAKGKISDRSKILEYYLQIMMRNPENYESQNYANILWAMGSLGFHDKSVVNHILHDFRENMLEYRKQEFENILWGQRILQHDDELTINAALFQATKMIQNRNNQKLTTGAAVELLLSLAHFGYEQRQSAYQLLKFFEQEGKFKQLIAGIFYCATYEHDVNEDSILRVLIQKFNKFWMDEREFSDQHLQWLLWSQLIYWSKGEMRVFPQKLLDLCEQPFFELQSKILKSRSNFREEVGSYLNQKGIKWEGGARIDQEYPLKVDILLENGTVIGLGIDEDYSSEGGRKEMWRLRVMRKIMRNMSKRFVVVDEEEWKKQTDKSLLLDKLIKSRR